MKRTVLSKIERGRQLPCLGTILNLVAGLEVPELLRDDAPKVAPREKPDAAWVRHPGRALRELREERGLTRQELADRSPTTADFTGRQLSELAATLR